MKKHLISKLWAQARVKPVWQLVAYGAAVAVAAFILTWIEYQQAALLMPTQLYVVVVALFFAGLGIWAGRQLGPKSRAETFERNEQALKALKISPREFTILEHLADGLSNKEIARALEISPNTVKTHLARLFGKLEVARRTQAITKARELALIP